ncbi:hypothetical protein [Rhizobium sp. MHM7A]|uniref:hypothetical protein n=1 Tax=Rhizobium sp. MHM7A TaxID=2583233 RepID=UPI0011075B64|nr:hypothetical protein [Rhizobium sp. MHM7A]TLX16099.1 hypothetical protein FFR93_01895 [Rhizobium sp. MHM7A]
MAEHLGIAPDYCGTGTINSSGKIVTSEKEILTALVTGGELRGMYTARGATEFELLTGEQVKAEDKRGIMEIGSGAQVPQSVMRSLAEKGLISIPPRQGPRNRVAIAKLQPKLSLISG